MLKLLITVVHFSVAFKSSIHFALCILIDKHFGEEMTAFITGNIVCSEVYFDNNIATPVTFCLLLIYNILCHPYI